MRAHGNRLDDVGTPVDASIHDDLGTTIHRLNDLRQHVQGASIVIELTSAMVGDIHHVDTMIDRDGGILGRGDTFQDQWNLELGFDAVHILPGQCGLKLTSWHHTSANIALSNVTLTPAVVGAINSQAECGTSRCLRPSDKIIHPGCITMHVKLEHAQGVWNLTLHRLKSHL